MPDSTSSSSDEDPPGAPQNVVTSQSQGGSSQSQSQGGVIQSQGGNSHSQGGNSHSQGGASGESLFKLKNAAVKILGRRCFLNIWLLKIL